MTISEVTELIDEIKTGDGDPLTRIDAKIAALDDAAGMLRSIRGLFEGGAKPPGKSKPGTAKPSPGERKPRAPKQSNFQERQLRIARKIEQSGPIKAKEAAEAAGCPYGSIYSYLHTSWFANENDGWTLTAEGRSGLRLSAA